MVGILVDLLLCNCRGLLLVIWPRRSRLAGNSAASSVGFERGLGLSL